MDAVLTVEEAARLLGVSTGTVRSRAHQGRLPGQKVGNAWRFSRQALLDWLKGLETLSTRTNGDQQSVTNMAAQAQWRQVSAAFTAIGGGQGTPEQIALIRAVYGEEAIRPDGTINSLAVAAACAEPLGPEFSSEYPHCLAARGDRLFTDE